jgi:arylsulfatase A-like enzyme
MKPKRPNILVIMTDQHRGDALGCAWPRWRSGSSPLRTPAIDSIAADGIRFSRCSVNNPLCMPSRSTLLTGLTPRAHGVRTNGIDLDPRIPTIGGALADAGYATYSSGKIHMRAYDLPKGINPGRLAPKDYPESQWMWSHGKISRLPSPYYGFQRTDFTGGHTSWMWGEYVQWLNRQDPKAFSLLQWERGIPPKNGAEQTWRMPLPPELHYNTWIADRAISYLDGAAKTPKPFLAFASFPDPHHAFAVPDPWYSMYDRDSIPLPVRRKGELDSLAPFFKKTWKKGIATSGRHGPTKYRDDQIREIIAVTYGMVSFVDSQAGRILAALDRLGLRDNTVVVFTADHGDMLGDHWLINKGPYHFNGLLNVPSIWSIPGGPRGAVSDELVSHLDFAPTILDLAGVPQMEYGPPRGTRIVTPAQMRALPGRSLARKGSAPARNIPEAVLVENDEDYIGLRLRTVITKNHQLTVYIGESGEMPFGELFDLRNDPGQLHNRWSDPAFRRVKAGLKEQLLAELVRTDNRLPRRSWHA